MTSPSTVRPRGPAPAPAPAGRVASGGVGSGLGADRAEEDRRREEELVAGLVAATGRPVADAHRRGLRSALARLRPQAGPVEHRPEAAARVTRAGTTRSRTHQVRGRGRGHGGLVRWLDPEPGDELVPGPVTRWPALGVGPAARPRGGAAPDRCEGSVAGGESDVSPGAGGGLVSLPLCPAVRTRAAGAPRCHRLAGADTDHPGVGVCKSHGGNWARGRAEAGWILGHGFAQELNVSPWEALLKAVRIAAGKSAYCEFVLSQAPDDRAIEGRSGPVTEPEGVSADGTLVERTGRDWSWWVAKSELWHDRLARVSKLAIDAGVAERVVAQLTSEAEVVARVLTRTLAADELGLTEEQRLAARAVLRRELTAVEAEVVAAEVAGTGDAVSWDRDGA